MICKLIIPLFVLLVIAGCSNIPSSEEIESDVGAIDIQLNDASAKAQQYTGGLLAVLTQVRVETLTATKTMLEQKKIGLTRFIPIAYAIDGKKYSPPENKNELLQELEHDLENLKKDLAEAEKEDAQYGGGLFGLLSSAKVATIGNSIAFLEQRKLLLKHDIPYYAVLPAGTDDEPGFKATPGKDIDKF